jgi:AAHS family 4-hydroxybenzoate transporter-like MFS transporter
MMGEYCPDNRRARLTNLMFCGFPPGAAFGGFLAAWMIPQFGWRSVLALGGTTPLILGHDNHAAGVSALHRRKVTAGGKNPRRAQANFRQCGRRKNVRMTEKASHAATSKNGLALVLSRPFLFGLVIFYALINWVPILLRAAGIDSRTATLISALYPLGRVGAVAFGALMDRFNPNRIIAAGYALTAITVVAIGQSVGNVGILMVSCSPVALS